MACATFKVCKISKLSNGNSSFNVEVKSQDSNPIPADILSSIQQIKDTSKPNTIKPNTIKHVFAYLHTLDEDCICFYTRQTENIIDQAFIRLNTDNTKFNTIGEDNPISCILKQYKVLKKDDAGFVSSCFKFVKEKTGICDKYIINDAIHDGWTLSRLITTTSGGKFDYKFKSSNLKNTDDQVIVNLTDTRPEILTLISYLLNRTEPILAKLSNVFIQIDFTIKSDTPSTTIIRAEELRDFLPHALLLENKKNNIINEIPTYTQIPEIFSLHKTNIMTFDKKQLFKSSQRAGSTRTYPKTPINYPIPSSKRILVAGQTRIVHVGKRGGEYIKQKGEFISLAKTSTTSTSSNSSPMATSKRVTLAGKSRIVYVGKRGGEYTKQKGKFIALK